ncbi:MAG: glycosyltransferase [Candidatus Aenigmarchaeota archaeon]|nr:glycosyltransferase [Candidatus Aenigmarchaeota archaeon]
MKIAMFTDSYEPQINGVVTSINNFTSELRKMGHEVHIFAPKDPKYKPKDRFVHCFDSLQFKPYPEYRIGLTHSFLINSLFNKTDFDVIHVHTPFTLGITGLLLAKSKRIPIIGTFHTLISEYTKYLVKIEKLEEIGKKTAWAFTSWFYNNCDIIIVPTKEIKRVAIKNGLKKPIKILPTGIRLTRKKYDKRRLKKKYKLDDKTVLLHVGRVCKEKNIDFIIKSMKYVPEGIILIITSDGPAKKELEKMVKEEALSEKVVFTGYLSNKKLDEIYGLSDIFLMASETDTQGLVLLEALQHGLPLVVTKAPVISDFVKKNKVGLVSRRNHKEFADKIIKLSKDKRLYNQLLKNKDKTLETYDIKRCTKELLKIYHMATS